MDSFMRRMDSRKQKITRIALQILRERGTDGLTLGNLSRAACLSSDLLAELFPEGDKELLMDTMAAAGVRWVEALRTEMKKTAEPSERLAHLARGFVLGSGTHPEILSVYIDLWKLVKDREDSYVRQRLCELYQFYSASFAELLLLAGVRELPQGEREALSLLFTVLSDAVHVQSVTLNRAVDFEMLSTVTARLLLRYYSLPERTVKKVLSPEKKPPYVGC